jgi:adenine deaminase
MFCSDDKHPDDLLNGHINSLVIRSLEKGYDLFDVLLMASINPIEHYGLDVGELRVGDKADFIEVQDLKSFKNIRTFINGEVVSKDGKTMIESVDVAPINNFHALATKASDFLFDSACEKVEVIQVIDHELFTKEKIYHTQKNEGFCIDLKEDILKISVINRYKNSKPSVGFINGFKLKSGAFASCVAHDSHNIIAVGCSDEEISKAVNLLVTSKGGICAVKGDTSLHLPLSVGGIMSNRDAFSVASKYKELDRFVKSELGSTLSAPFMTLSFMALLVIPEIKLSDKGLFDGREFHFIPTCIE